MKYRIKLKIGWNKFDIYLCCIDPQKFINIILPDFASQAFDVINIYSDSLRIDIFPDEKKIVPSNMRNKHLISHGFTPVTTIEDFPVRGKAVYLHIRRRKWLDGSDKRLRPKRYTSHSIVCGFYGSIKTIGELYLANGKQLQVQYKDHIPDYYEWN